MDAWVIGLKSGGGVPVFGPMRKHEKRRLAPPLGTDAGWIDARVSLRGFRPGSPARNHRSVVVRARGKKKNDPGGSHSSSGKNDPSHHDEDGLEGGTSPHDEGSKSDNSSGKSHNVLSDWRDFRANLVRCEKEHILHSDTVSEGTDSHESPQMLGMKWAHPIPMPETGCILVATEKLDGVPSFERTVILLLKLGSRGPREGPFGIILNRPLHRKIKHMKPSNSDLATVFSDCSVHCGGPLEANMFLLRSDENVELQGFEKVVSEVCFGARNNLHEAAALVKQGVLTPQDFRFFVGYAGWQYDQLLDEIESEYWVVAACSSLLINEATSDSSSNLWEEVLQLMGGKYSEMSRKPKQDSP